MNRRWSFKYYSYYYYTIWVQSNWFVINLFKLNYLFVKFNAFLIGFLDLGLGRISQTKTCDIFKLNPVFQVLNFGFSSIEFASSFSEIFTVLSTLLFCFQFSILCSHISIPSCSYGAHFPFFWDRFSCYTTPPSFSFIKSFLLKLLQIYMPFCSSYF